MSTNKISLQSVIFREYDIRGTVDVDLSNDVAYLIGRAYGTLAKEHGKNNIAVGRDCRLSSPEYAAAVCRGISDEGVNAVSIGMCPTPLSYFSTFQYNDIGGSIEITGSHNPSDMNGFKLCLGTVTLSGDQIQDIRSRCEKLNGTPLRAPTKGSITTRDVIPDYITWITDNIKSRMGKRKLKVVVDAGNGVGGMTGPTVLRNLGVEVIELFCEPDGRFPNHHPDPTELKNIKLLAETVKKTGADVGIGWDGDADRIGAVDDKGNVIFGDMLLLIFGRAILKENPGATGIGDVKCSRLLFDDLKQKGAKPIMWKTGHSLIKAKLRETGGDLGGEMSGHIFFKNRFFGFDDAIYASARLVEILSNTDKKCSELLADLPKMVSTPEIRVDCPEEIKFKVPEKAKEVFKSYTVDTTDGVRINFEKGWGLIRASNTQPVLVMRFEAESDALLKEYEMLVGSRLEEIKAALSA